MPPAETGAQLLSASAEADAGRRTLYRAFGLTWASTFALPMIKGAPGAEPDVALGLCENVDPLWSGDPRTPEWRFRIDGRRFVIERGWAGDFRLSRQDGVRFHLDREATSISCEPPVVSDPASRRLLLDTVLWTTTLLRGLEGLHASAVLTEAGVVAFLAGSGGGKTSIAFELVRRGYPLVCDDVLIVERRRGGFVAHPSPPVMNLPAAMPLHGVRVDPIARIGEESWVSAAHVATQQPSRLAHLFLLERAPGFDRRVVDMEPTALDLLRHAQVHAFVESWERRRFELCSDLAVGVPLSRVEAGDNASPSVIADLVEQALGGAEAA